MYNNKSKNLINFFYFEETFSRILGKNYYLEVRISKYEYLSI